MQKLKCGYSVKLELSDHVDHIRAEERPQIADEDAQSLQELAAGDGNLIMWGPYQRVSNEPLEQVCIINKGEWKPYTYIYQFYWNKILNLEIGYILKNDKVVHEFHTKDWGIESAYLTTKDYSDIVSDGTRIGKIFYKTGILMLDFAKNPGDIKVVCTYDRENA